MEDEAQAEGAPPRRRHHRVELALDSDPVDLGGEAEAAREAPDVGVDGQAGQAQAQAQAAGRRLAKVVDDLS